MRKGCTGLVLTINIYMMGYASDANININIQTRQH